MEGKIDSIKKWDVNSFSFCMYIATFFNGLQITRSLNKD